MQVRTLLGFAVFFVACGGSVVPVDDGKNPPPGSTSTNPNDPSSPGRVPTSRPPSSATPPSTTVPVPAVIASAYDQTCNANDDCVPLTELGDCGCSCPNAAINKRDLERSQKDLSAHWAACQQNHAPGCGALCMNGHAFCDTSDGLVGTCKSSRP